MNKCGLDVNKVNANRLVIPGNLVRKLARSIPETPKDDKLMVTFGVSSKELPNVGENNSLLGAQSK